MGKCAVILNNSSKAIPRPGHQWLSKQDEYRLRPVVPIFSKSRTSKSPWEVESLWRNRLWLSSRPYRGVGHVWWPRDDFDSGLEMWQSIPLVSRTKNDEFDGWLGTSKRAIPDWIVLCQSRNPHQTGTVTDCCLQLPAMCRSRCQMKQHTPNLLVNGSSAKPSSFPNEWRRVTTLENRRRPRINSLWSRISGPCSWWHLLSFRSPVPWRHRWPNSGEKGVVPLKVYYNSIQSSDRFHSHIFIVFFSLFDHTVLTFPTEQVNVSGNWCDWK